MSEFSNLLTRLISKKDTKVYSMAKYCGLDRSTMYKIMNGTRRPPSEEVLYKMADFMHLTPSERSLFREAFDITLMGDGLYYRRKNIQDFILNFPSVSNVPRFTLPHEVTDSALDLWCQDLPGCAALPTSLELEHTLYHMIRAESHKAQGKIGLFLQPDYDFLFGMLTGQLSSSMHLRIEHLFCLSRSEKAVDDRNFQNVRYLKKLIPLYASALDYHPHYFYDDIHAHYYNYNLFPCLILTPDYAVACASDYSSGILYHDAQILSMMWDFFHSCQSRSAPLFHVVSSVLDECRILGNMGWDETASYAIQPEPCLIPYLTEEMLEAAVYPHIPGRASMLPQLWSYISGSRARIPNPNMHIYHTRNGILKFAETGRILEVPLELYRPLPLEERRYLLTQLAAQCHTGCYRLLKAPLEILPENLHISVNESGGYLLFTNARGENIYLIIQEPGLLSYFFDYADSLDEKYLESPAETERFVREVIDSFDK